MLKLAVSPKYKRNYRKQSEAIKRTVIEREAIFLRNPHDARLETHKLHGKDRDAWAYSVTHKIRIKFLFISTNIVMYLDIGTHDEVY